MLIGHILWSLSPANKLACEIALQTGWRIDDVLELRTDDIRSAIDKNGSISITEKKTGKKSTKRIKKELLRAVLTQSGRLWAFEGRDDYRKHRSRQAVYADLKRSARHFKIKINLSPHSLRKNYAVSLMKEKGSITDVQKALNHDNLTTTIIYAMADELSQRHK